MFHFPIFLNLHTILFFRFDLTEEDEEMMSSGTGALPVTITDWSSMTNGRIAPPSIMSAASAFDLTASGMQNSLRSVLPTSTIGHAPMLANRSLSQPAPLSPTSLDPDRRLVVVEPSVL